MTGREGNVSPLAVGPVLGFAAALVQAFFKVAPPVACGGCLVCHPKDLVNRVANAALGTEWPYSLAATAAPLLTVVGVMLGALLAACQPGELKLCPARQPLVWCVNVFLMINFGPNLGSCPIRIVLLSAHGGPPQASG